MVDWSTVLGELITQFLRIMIPVGIALILKWAGELWLKMKAQVPEIAEVLNFACQLATRAAEQEYGGKHGEEKKQYAIEFVQKYLAEHGLKVDVSVIASSIEASVFGMNGYKRYVEESNASADNAE